ncbi:glycosyltransferase family 2 protein [Flavobacterium wongokense]|uniref:glycosyltransferase family 2 protein n=1 Tax=Flavobacterium wongokense TaxID=2910674 RepID=UPI001F216346|nr:glycosyltransferase family 2 protein [Flavobacterium sp. WG47]MCF6132711.1 glycosyltransferase [Flavobacterium sp. WG47]
MMLVSVPVATYNSVDFIIETLESIYNQTYKEIELLISDDFSTDGTIEKVDEWIKQERVINRFVRIEFIKVPANTGISANCNRFIKACQSDWVKMIAGDDILLPNCIEDNVKFISENPDAQIVFSQVRLYQDTFEEKNFLKTIPKSFPDNLMNPSFTAQDQYKILLIADRLHYSPSFLLNKKAINSVGGYDETNRLVEDYPMWLKLTGTGIRLYYFHKETVGYRMHSKATNNNGQDVLIKPSEINNYKIRKKYAHPHLPKLQVLDEGWTHNIALLFKNMGITRKTKVNVSLYKLMTVYLNPFFYAKAVSKKIS